MKSLNLLSLGIALILASCATGPNAAVTGSSASGLLLRDTTQMVLLMDSAAMPTCKEERSITATPLASDKPGTIAERWQVERCGTKKFYRVTYTPTPSIGGTDFSVKAER